MITIVYNLLDEKWIMTSTDPVFVAELLSEDECVPEGKFIVVSAANPAHIGEELDVN